MPSKVDLRAQALHKPDFIRVSVRHRTLYPNPLLAPPRAWVRAKALGFGLRMSYWGPIPDAHRRCKVMKSTRIPGFLVSPTHHIRVAVRDRPLDPKLLLAPPRAWVRVKALGFGLRMSDWGPISDTLA